MSPQARNHLVHRQSTPKVAREGFIKVSPTLKIPHTQAGPWAIFFFSPFLSQLGISPPTFQREVKFVVAGQKNTDRWSAQIRPVNPQIGCWGVLRAELNHLQTTNIRPISTRTLGTGKSTVEELVAPRCGINTKLLPPQHAAPLAIGRVELVSSVISGKQPSENWEPVRALQTTTMADAPVLLPAWLLQGFSRRLTPVVPGRSARPRWARRRGGDCREPRLCNALSGDRASSARWAEGERKRLGRDADRALAVMCIGAGARRISGGNFGLISWRNPANEADRKIAIAATPPQSLFFLKFPQRGGRLF